MSLTPAQCNAIKNGLLEIEAMDATGKLASRRLAFRRSLDEAKEADHSAASRRSHAAEHTREAKKLRALIERIERTHAEFTAAMRDAATVSFQRAFPQLKGYVLAPDQPYFVTSPRQVHRNLVTHRRSHTSQAEQSDEVADVLDYLRWQESINKYFAKWYRSGTTEKPTQWGPATLKSVETIAEATANLISAENIRKDAKPKQQGDYYAALLCMQAGVFEPSVAAEPSKVADQVRKRLDRGLSTKSAKDHAAASRAPAFFPSPPANFVRPHDVISTRIPRRWIRSDER